jgi:iron complex transport system substrate-binding protein
MAMSPRIVSLLPSATEIVCALGLRDSLVGRSHECDYPSDVTALPAVTAPKLDVHRTSREIDRDVRELVRSGLGVYRIDGDRLAELRPDLIVTQDQCDVCAVSYAEVKRAAQDLFGPSVEIVSLRPARLADVWRDIENVAAAAGCASRGSETVTRLRDRMAALEARTRHLDRPRLACIEWLDPLMAAGNWLPDLANIAGAAYDMVAPGEHSAWLSWEDVVSAAPEVICAMPCGFGLAQTERELARLGERPEWRALPAVRSGRAFAVDGSAYFNRPGPRLVESAEILASIVHPAECGSSCPAGAVRRIAPAAVPNLSLPA